jgi:outer membrane protein OmpA-like peptidoglycan-associated protein
MRYLAFFLLYPLMSQAQYVTDFPYFQNSNNPDLIIQKVQHNTLNTTLTFKFTYKKKGNTNVLGSILGLNPEKVAVCIRDRSFLVDTLSGKKYELMRATNIPYCSSGRTYLVSNQSLVFDLYFERLEPGVEVFDFKEGAFFDTTLINKHTWSILGIEAANPELGKKSKITSKTRKSESIRINEIDSGNVFHFVETKAIMTPESEQLFKVYLTQNMARLSVAKVIRIEGHSDKIGDFEKNRKLSMERAAFVKELLVQEKIDAEKIEIKGYSHLKILSLKRDETSKLRNRRVEIIII